MEELFEIKATVKPDSDTITCEVHSGSLSFDETMGCMIKLRNHLTVRIEAASSECPLGKKWSEAH